MGGLWYAAAGVHTFQLWLFRLSLFFNDIRTLLTCQRGHGPDTGAACPRLKQLMPKSEVLFKNSAMAGNTRCALFHALLGFVSEFEKPSATAI